MPSADGPRRHAGWLGSKVLNVTTVPNDMRAAAVAPSRHAHCRPDAHCHQNGHRHTVTIVVVVVVVVVVVTMIKPPPRRSNTISRTATAIFIAVWLVVIHTVSNSSAGFVFGPAGTVASIGDTTTDRRSAERRNQHCDTPARRAMPAD
jgi:glycerol uptake facilitator-like aquaporin